MDQIVRVGGEMFQNNPKALIITYGILFVLLVLVLTVPAIILMVVIAKKMCKKMHILNPLDFLNEPHAVQKIPSDTIVKCPHCGNRGKYNHGFCSRCGKAIDKEGEIKNENKQ